MIFKLSEYSIRPVILLDDLFKGCSALLDTGASFPVWTGDREMLVAIGGVSKKTKVTFGGFGGTTTGELFYLNLTLGDYVFPNMPIIYKYDNDIPGFMVLSASMFSKIELYINIDKHYVRMDAVDNQKCFLLREKLSDGRITVFCES